MIPIIISADFPENPENFEAPFSAWVHADKKISGNYSDCIRKMIEGGCKYFLFSGFYGSKFEEISDLIAEEFADELVLTSTSDQPIEECAEYFLCIENVQNHTIRSRWIVVLSGNAQEQDDVLEKVIDSLRGSVPPNELEIERR